jgi:hypothetical protein
MLTISNPSPLSVSPATTSGTPEPWGKEAAGGKEALQHFALYSSAHVDVAYNRLHHYLYCNWKSAPAGESLRAEVQNIGHLLRGQGCSKVLNDHRRLGWTYRVASLWFQLDFLAPLRAAGLGKMAWIVSSNPLLQLATVLPLRRLDEKGAVLRSFSDESAAKLWLLEKLA